MSENLTPEQEKFRSFCVDQVQRLSQFKQFEFMSSPAQRDYRKWLERKCVTPDRVERVMDAAVEFPAMPTIADLNSILSAECGLISASREADRSCLHCAGSGFESHSVGGCDFAKACRCSGKPPLNDSQRNWEAGLSPEAREIVSAAVSDMGRAE